MIKTETEQKIYLGSLHVAYDTNSEEFHRELSNLMNTEYPQIKFEAFHENKLRQRTKAFRVKGGYSARKTPFAVLLNAENNPIKAFYSEVEECTVDVISLYIDSFITLKQMSNESTSN